MGDGEGAFLAPSLMSLYRVMSLKGQTFYKVMSHIGQVVGAGDEAFLATHHAGKEAFLASSPHMSLYRAMSLKGLTFSELYSGRITAYTALKKNIPKPFFSFI